MIEKLSTWLEDTLRIFVPLRFEAVRGRYDGTYAERTERFASSAAWQAETLGLLDAASLPSGVRLLDLGCNTGMLLALLHDNGLACDYTGVDINAAAIDRCKERFGDAGLFLHFDGKHVPMEGGSQDVVVANHVLGHVAQPVNALREVYRLLRHNGKVVIATPNRLFKQSKIVANLTNGYRPDRTVLRFFSNGSLKKVLHDSGFADIRIWSGGEPGLHIFGEAIQSSRARLFAIARKP